MIGRPGTKMRLLLTYLALLTVPLARAGSTDSLREAFVRAASSPYVSDEGVARRFIDYSEHGRANDVLLIQLYLGVHLPDDEVRQLQESLLPSGAWPDIDYTDRTRGRWQPSLHLTRLQALAKLYASPQSRHYRDRRLLEKIHAGIGYWLRTDPQSLNWWHKEIGAPKKLAATLLMLGEEATGEEIAGGVRILKRSRFGRTGQNKVWLAGNNLMRGLLENDTLLVRRARDTIAAEIRIAAGEGIQPDFSFQQHGPQIQFGNYGLAYAQEFAFWNRVLEGSPYAFTDEQYGLVGRLLTDGICRSVWQGMMDPSFCGRQVFIDAGRGKACAAAVAARNMAATHRPEGRKFDRIARRILAGRNPLPAGADYYWRSDCGIFRTRKWYASERMHSERTIGFETTNGENRLANFSADGALLLMQHGAEYENIFAAWDWRQVPGTTAYDDGRPIRDSQTEEEKTNRSQRVGGLACGRSLITTMELQRDSLHALKTNFFFGKLIVALGCGIRSSDASRRELFTTLEQNLRRGAIRLGTATEELRIDTGSVVRRFGPGELRWIHHDGRGYVPLGGERVTLSATLQHGKWDFIDPFYDNRTDSARIFKCRIDHPRDTAGGYAYAILPCRSARQTARFAARNSLRMLRNDTVCQAVAYKGAVCAVFHAPGAVAVGDAVVQADAPAAVLLDLRRRRIAASSLIARELHLRIRGRRRQLEADIRFPDDPALRGSAVRGQLKKSNP